MPHSPSAQPPIVRRWLLLLAALIAMMVVVGGYVRLSRAGLSIVEWEVITGVVPPIGDAAWRATFDQYLRTPEGMTVNAGMSLDEYKRIYLIEWGHRFIARFVGLVLVIPLAAFLWRGTIPWRGSAPYLLIAAGFGFQGFLGWYMVASGLVDRPSVSHFRLTAHLLAALALLALCLWLALREEGERPASSPPPTSSPSSPPSPLFVRIAQALMVAIVVQIAYGGLVAGLKAGHISNTWPLMFGRLVPPGVLGGTEPVLTSLISAPATVHFVHRWFAFVVLALALWLVFAARRERADRRIVHAGFALAAIVIGQILLGVAVVLSGVPLSLALTHQGMGVAIFALAVYANVEIGRERHRTRRRTAIAGL